MIEADFVEFFAAVNGGAEPYSWQRRLLHHLMKTGCWPDEIVAPTGSGKSAVVEVHVFANALAAVNGGTRVPRRLAVAVNRRGLVDNHFQRATAILEQLRSATGGLVAEVAAGLGRLRTTGLAEEGQWEPLVVRSLRGGAPRDNSWRDDPSACAVLAVTPDMWGSRLLFHGWGASRLSRPCDAGLLSTDAALVLDEAHLNEQLLLTARRAAEMHDADARALGVPGLQVSAMTATPTDVRGGRTRVGVEEADLMQDDNLQRRLTVKKPVRLAQTPWSGGKGRLPKRHVDVLVDEAISVEAAAREHQEGTTPARTIGVIVNRVETAVRVAHELRTRVPGALVEVLVGRMRPLDVDRLRSERPGLLSVKGDDEVRFLVATQTVEVGVDLDLAGMVTELAPASALAQRAGRVDRLGLRGDCTVVVVAPDLVNDNAPYRQDELAEALVWLADLMDDVGMQPWRLTHQPRHLPPSATRRRLALTHLQRAEVERLADTSVPPFAEPELEFYLRDDLEAERPLVGIVQRKHLPLDANSALELLRLTPVADREQYPVGISTAKTVLSWVLEEGEPARLFRARPDEDPVQVDGTDDVRPGDVFIIDRQPITMGGVVVRDVPCPPEDLDAVWGDGGVEVWFAGPGSRPIDALEDLSADEAATVVGQQRNGPVEVMLPVAHAAGIPEWAVIRPRAEVVEDEATRQEWNAQRVKVSLDDHSNAVAARAQLLGERLKLKPQLVEALRLGGLWHDRGKSDHRFQRQILRAASDELLAKNGERTAQQRRRDRASSTLPRGWRHEQLSAAMAHAELSGSDSDLVVRLVGTSHGHGRMFFPHSADTMVESDQPEPVSGSLQELFSAGLGWSRVLSSTERRYGVWGCAYLESVLRSADCMVSKEGS